MSITILGIESSCDDTSASIIRDGFLLSNVIANQNVHIKYGGVVPELASRAHQQNIIPVITEAINLAGIKKSEISAVAFTKGPGLLGSLLVGTSFSKGFALANNIPLIEINHLQAHVLVHFIKEKEDDKLPEFPFLCLLVSGGHTQIIVVRNFFDMEIIGTTIDDAAGEAFDKCAKTIGLPYPGGPHVDKNAQLGNKLAFKFTKPIVPNLDYSFSGLKTNFLYFLRDNMKLNSEFINENMNDLCASLQYTIVEMLADKLMKAVKQTGIKRIAIAGGVSANSGLKAKIVELGEKHNLETYIPPFKFTTDNGAMIAITGYYKYLVEDFSNHNVSATARYKF
jgi:N6-L-threonylcarbamoyladenine synthase